MSSHCVLGIKVYSMGSMLISTSKACNNFFNFIISLDRHRAFSSSGDLALMVSVLSEGIDTYRLAIGPLTWRGGLREIGGQPCAAPNQASAPLSAKVTWRPNSAISDFRHALVLSNGILDLATPRKFSEMLLNLPTEIQEAIVVECAIVRPSMIAALAKTCHALRLLIGIPPDHHLWRSIFLSIFDDPRPALSIQSGEPLGHSAASFDWQREAQRRFRAAIRMDRAAMAEMGEFKNIVDQDAIDALMNTALLSSPVDSNFASEPASLNEAWLENCLQAAIIPKAKTQHLAKLHILASFAHVRTSVSLPAASTITGACRLRSRAYTYDMRNYTQGNHWGPWKPDSKGDVNWEHLWHLINVIRHNAYQRSSADLPCTGLKSLLARSVPKTLDDPVTEWNDWAGVQGVWVRAISFMDYRDLHEYNDYSHENEDGSLPTRIFEHLQFDEAFRLIKGYFSVLKVEPKGPPNYPHRPTIHFVGDASLPSYPQNTMVHRITQGTVSMTEHGHIRWSFVTHVGGNRWSSEGVQVGDVQSRAGVVGVWSSADHAEGDPAGPFWLWRSGEGKDSLKAPQSPHLHYHLVVNLANQQ